ncbi:MAG: glucuronosyltransferase [Chloroflexi bacterium]|nr:glucuronosyltransferase [Chloroflexota bacterium]
MNDGREGRRVVLVSGHYLESHRKAGFHWLAEAYWQQGWDVTFVTASLSWLSKLRRDHRFAYPVREEANRLREVRERLRSYVLFTPWHPANLRLGALNWLSAPLFRRYGRASIGELTEPVANADVIIFESTPGLLLCRQFRELNPRARFIYRVSDDLRLLNSHPVVLEVEREVAPAFDLVSVPSRAMLQLFTGLDNVRLDLHGIEKGQFDAPSGDPYGDHSRPVAVFAGNSHFDHDFLERASRLMPGWAFHIVGPIAGIPALPNVTTYGEMPFAATIPYLQHADVGLQIRAYSPGAESLSDSLKVLQYSYCQLPIVAPDFLRSSRANVVYYRPGDDASITGALTTALAMDRGAIPIDDICSWGELASRLVAA